MLDVEFPHLNAYTEKFVLKKFLNNFLIIEEIINIEIYR